MSKECFKCGEIKPLDDFYVHPEMADGHLGKCKECTKRDVKKRCDDKPEMIAAYKRKRFQDPSQKAYIAERQRRMRARNPEKTRARQMVGNAVRDGRLIRLPCQVCGDKKSQAHHHDYSKPMDVQWLCFKHHREIGHGQRVLADGRTAF